MNEEESIKKNSHKLEVNKKSSNRKLISFDANAVFLEHKNKNIKNHISNKNNIKNKENDKSIQI